MDMTILSVAALSFAVTCMVFTATTVRNDRCHQDRRSIDAMTTVLNERVVWEKTGVLVLEAELMRQQIGSTKTEPLIPHLSLTSH